MAMSYEQTAEELLKLKDSLHNSGSYLTVIGIFLECIDSSKLSQSHRDLHASAKEVLEKMKKDYDVAADLACYLSSCYPVEKGKA
ncbi:MAG: hypothetical protein HY540_02020 [Deltaproteobacteria bacterium]|nr:hypothetical protein [Deltaproteobacteria bacterium]